MYKAHAIAGVTSFRNVIVDESASITARLKEFNRDLKADFLFIGAIADKRINTLITLNGDNVIDNIEYPLDGSPCQHVISNKVCAYETDIISLFPNDEALKELGADAYLGAAIQNENAENIGLLVALFLSPQKQIKQAEYSFDIFAEYLSTFIQKCHLTKHSSELLTMLNEGEVMTNSGTWEYKVEHGITFWSENVFRIYGLPISSALAPSNAMQYYAEHDRQKISTLFDRAVRYGETYETELEFIDAQGIKKWVRTSGRPDFDDGGNICRIFGAIEDITHEKSLITLIDDRSRYLNNILNSVRDSIISIDDKGIIKHCNEQTCLTFGYKSHEMIGNNISFLMPEPYSSKHNDYLARHLETGQNKIIGIGRQLPALRKDGSLFQMELAITKLIENGRAEYIGVVRDISERIEAQDAIYNLAYTDNVTNLRNSQWFKQECQDLMQQAISKQDYMYVLLVDIDRMAQFNLQVGFSSGDEGLKLIAENLKQVMGNGFRVYKYTNDSFIILAQRTYSLLDIFKFNIDETEQVLLNPLNYRVMINNQERVLSASIGSAILDPDKQSFETMLHMLEMALSKAKLHAPFGLYHLAGVGVAEYERYISIQQLLKSVCNTDELSLVFQPQYNGKKQLRSFEALLRWNSSQYGFISPSEFIPLAEESEAIIYIGDWVILNACKAIQFVQQAGLNTPISVNVSAKQIISPDFIDKLISTTKHFNVAPQMMIIELTETALIADIEVVKNTMITLHSFGFHFSIDDFGIGYSSLAYLRELPISELKIDKYFIDDIEKSDVDAMYPIVNMILDMASALNVRCVAEGVELQAQFDYLQNRGCEIFQGYLLSKPIDMSTWKKLIHEEAKQLHTKHTYVK